MGYDRRQFLKGTATVGGTAFLGATSIGCAPMPTLDAATPVLSSLWDAIVPGTWHGVVADRLASGAPAPGATDAGVQEWITAQVGSMPGQLNYITDWFLRAWAADLNLWSAAFHPFTYPSPTFDELPLGPTSADSGRQYKIMLMQAVFDGFIEPLDLKYFGGIVISKAAFYGDFHAETTGAPRVGGPYIGFPGPTGAAPTTDFGYNHAFGVADPRMITTPGGLVAIP